MDVETDEALMLRVAGGDRRAFAQLFDRYAAQVVRFAARFTGDTARAEELAQDVFVKLFRSARSYKPTAKFKTFLFRVATNHCLNEVRRGEYRAPRASIEREDDRDPPAEHDVPAAPETSPEQALWGRELEHAVGEALGALSDRERAAFVMCRFEGLSYKDIADALGASDAAVKSLIHRATLAVAQRIDALQAGEGPARSRA